MTTKKSPNLAAAVEKDLTSDLRKVGGFFRGLVGFTERAERTIKAATEPTHPESASPPKAIGRGLHDGGLPHTSVVVKAVPCDVCGGDRVVGGAKKIPCPECS